MAHPTFRVMHQALFGFVVINVRPVTQKQISGSFKDLALMMLCSIIMRIIYSSEEICQGLFVMIRL